MQTVITTRSGACAILTLNRPDQLNALDTATIAGLEAGLDAAERDDSRAVIIAGNGRSFCAGADLKEALPDASVRVRQMHQLALRLASFPKTVIAAIQGHALGGGLELALSCTLRVAAANARLGLPEIRYGVMPGFGGTQLLPRVIGAVRATEMLMSGLPVDAAEAKSIGLVSLVVDDPAQLIESTLAFADRFTIHDPEASRTVRDVVRRGLMLPLSDALELERTEVARLAKRIGAEKGLGNFRNR